MSLMLTALGAELLQLHAVRVITTVLLGDVVALLALSAGERDLRANVARLLSHDTSSICSGVLHGGSGSGTRTRDTAIMSRLLYRLSYPAMGPIPISRGRTVIAYLNYREPPCGIEPQTFSLPWRRSTY